MDETERIRIRPSESNEYSRREKNSAETTGELYSSGQKGAEKGAPTVVPISDELARIVLGWDRMAEPVRLAVTALAATALPWSHSARSDHVTSDLTAEIG